MEQGEGGSVRRLRGWAAGGVLLLVGVILVSFWDGLTRNWADIEVGARDPRLRPIVRPEGPEEAVRRAREIIDALPRWRVESFDPEAGTLYATHETRMWRFVDDVHLRFEKTEDGCRITGHSRSRVGKGDLGQNARNLKELAGALRG